ncbi:MAG TPA: hypothetical protein VKB38_08785 [Terracidiphilus sp.]|nr:hypothetical protein [Terracidiphilus sp.]
MTIPRLVEATATLRVGVDALYAEFIEREVAISREIGDQPYRMSDFDLFDPEGNRVCFGEASERVGNQQAGEINTPVSR